MILGFESCIYGIIIKFNYVYPKHTEPTTKKQASREMPKRQTSGFVWSITRKFGSFCIWLAAPSIALVHKQEAEN